MPAKPLSSFLGLTAVMCAIGSGGCGLEFEMVTTPEPVTAGSPLTYDIKATNVTSCPVKPSEFTLFPLLSEEQVAEINAGLADAGIAISLELLCALAGGQLPEGISGDLAQRAAALKATTPEAFLGDLPQTASQSSAFTAETLPTTCVETELDGTSRIDCELGPLASGGTEETQIVLIPTEAGVFLNVVFGGGVSDGVCDAGANEGNACSGADDCPDGNCDDGICVEGNNNALGCEGDQDCDGGTCVECDQCAVPGVCTEGEKRGLECSSDADCDSNPENGTCLCGVSIACTTTTVEEPTPTSTPTSTPTPTSTATPTPTATPTTTPVPDGGPCATTSECDTGLVCLGGICRSTAPAPTTSHTGLLVALGLLATIAALALWRRRDARRSPMAGGVRRQ